MGAHSNGRRALAAFFGMSAGVVLLFGFGRGWRRYARQLGDVIEAAGRIAEGDLSTRVTERGCA